MAGLVSYMAARLLLAIMAVVGACALWGNGHSRRGAYPMIAIILLLGAYLAASFIFDMLVIGTIGHWMKELDEKANVPEDDRMASPLYVALSACRVCGLLYLFALLYDKTLPIPLFVAVAVFDIYRGCKQMLAHDDMGRAAIRNYFTAKTLGTAIGLCAMGYWLFIVRRRVRWIVIYGILKFQ